LEAVFGMIPNIAGAMANSPVLMSTLVGLFGNVHGGSSTEPRVQTVLLADAVTNACAWAVALHTALDLRAGLDPTDVEAICERRLPKDMEHAALSLLAKTLIEKRSRLEDQDTDSSPPVSARTSLSRSSPSSPRRRSRTIPEA
jgi:alkylhydroperoxidase family enzyme